MGPTAIGKSALAVYLAQHLGCEIISVDSMLVFRGMDIGTAKPGVEQQGGIPHHLIDILDPAQSYSTGQFREHAIKLIADIHRRGKIPLLAGGTMLYFKALFGGLADLPDADAQIRTELDQQAVRIGWQAMHKELAVVDPESAQRIHWNDPQRIQRALEVYRISGEPLSVLMKRRAQSQLPYSFIKLALSPEDRGHLHETIRIRFGHMLEQGLIQETRVLYERPDLDSKLPAMRAVGYRQVWAYLDQQLEYSAMVERAVVATRQLAKRQLTWLRSTDLDYHYIVSKTIPYPKILACLSNSLR
ncbi:MAG TPA: tRNA (adenosine(37)-N6)-dimethylallyltransferase MiaA [Crenotrichaceae bacterium]|nr:tRNA (adenosine(37)-N6)-dimethylallyltransferase MiaA [Crenotrichaceae bacterium]